MSETFLKIKTRRTHKGRIKFWHTVFSCRGKFYWSNFSRGDWVYTGICIVAKWQENKSVVKILFHHKINTDKWTLAEYGRGGAICFWKEQNPESTVTEPICLRKNRYQFHQCLFSDTQIWAILSDMIMSDFFFRCRRNLRSILDQMCKKFLKKVSDVHIFKIVWLKNLIFLPVIHVFCQRYFFYRMWCYWF